MRKRNRPLDQPISSTFLRPGMKWLRSNLTLVISLFLFHFFLQSEDSKNWNFKVVNMFHSCPLQSLAKMRRNVQWFKYTLNPLRVEPCWYVCWDLHVCKWGNADYPPPPPIKVQMSHQHTLTLGFSHDTFLLEMEFTEYLRKKSESDKLIHLSCKRKLS